MIRIKIDGRETQVKEGTYILEAARKIGIEIPALCFYQGLEPYGGCRLCIVEVKGEKKFVTACSYPVTKEIEVFTSTPEIIRLRKNILSLLLSNHPQDCMTCEKSGDCLLEKYAYEFGLRKPYFVGEKSKKEERDGKPFIIRDYEKCILCGKCVRVCDEIVGAQAIDFGYRGFDTTIVSGFDGSLKDNNCVFCGNCINVCPVGALREIQAEGLGRTWDFTYKNTVCPYCGVGCNLKVAIKDNKIIKITGDKESIVNKDLICIKGKFGFEYVNHPDRLKRVLVRTNSVKGEGAVFKEVDWDTGLKIVAERLMEIKQKCGPDSIAGFASAKCTNEENYLFQKFFRQVIGTNNVDHCARLCHAPSVSALAATVGSGAMTNSFDEIEHISDCIIVTGTNVTETQPVTSYKIRRAVMMGAKLIVIDPREIELSKIAHIYVQPRIGSDVMFFNGIAKILLEENLINKKFLQERVENFEQYEEFMKDFSLEKAEEITNVSIEKMREIANLYATSNAAVIVWAMGITQHSTGTDNVYTLSNLALLTGQIGRPGAGLCPLRGQNNVQGACDMGALPNLFPGYQKLDDTSVREKFERFWDVKIPDKPGLTIVETVSAINEGKIKGLYIMGENPVVTDPDINFTKQALEKIEFLVVQDIFLTETAMYADVVFPSCCSYEKDGSFTNTERRVQKLRKCVNPPGDAKPDWWIISEVAKMMGFNWDYKGVEEIMEEIRILTPIYSGINHQRLEKYSLQWPCPDLNHPGTQTLHLNGFSLGKAKLKCVSFVPPFEIPDSQFPFVLTTGRVLSEYHSRSMTKRVKGISELSGKPFCEINISDAKILKIKNRQKIRITSRRGQIEIEARLSKTVPSGTVFIPFHYAESAANILTHHHLDPVAKIPEYKICAVRIERI